MGIRDLVTKQASTALAQEDLAWEASAAADYLDQCYQFSPLDSYRPVVWSPARRAAFISKPEHACPASLFAWIAAQALRANAQPLDLLALHSMFEPLIHDLPHPTDAQASILADSFGWLARITGKHKDLQALRLAILKHLM